MRETRDDAWRHNGSRVLPGVLRRRRRGEGRRHTESPACLQGSCIKWNRAVTMALRPKASSHTIHVDKRENADGPVARAPAKIRNGLRGREEVGATGTRAVPRALFIINADCENNG
ncbi:unnamed protein product [Lampetra planeri]